MAQLLDALAVFVRLLLFPDTPLEVFGIVDQPARPARRPQASVLTSDASARFLITNFNSGPGQAFTDIYAFSEFLAPIIMGVALWRSRCVPRWLAVLFAMGFLLAAQTGSVGIAKVVLQMAPFAVAMVLLSVRIWRAAEPAEPVSNDQMPTLFTV